MLWLSFEKGAINEANGLNKLPTHLLKEKEEYLYRSYIGLGQYYIVRNEIKDGPNTPIGHQAIKLLATYLEDPTSKEIVVLQLKEWMSDPNASSIKTLQTIAATIYNLDDKINEAFKTVKNGSNMEQ